MKILDLRKKKSQNSNAACAVQTSIATNHPYYNLTSYMPINGESRVYAELRNAVPILDAAINKIVRLCEGFRFDTGNEKINDMMNSYFESINVGGNQRGITSFVSNYLNQLLTFGTAIGEIVMCSDGIYTHVSPLIVGFGFVFSYGLKIEVMVILGAPSPSARSRLRGSILDPLRRDACAR